MHKDSRQACERAQVSIDLHVSIDGLAPGPSIQSDSAVGNSHSIPAHTWQPLFPISVLQPVPGSIPEAGSGVCKYLSQHHSYWIKVVNITRQLVPLWYPQVNELARMSEQEVSEYRKQLNGIKVGTADKLCSCRRPLTRLCCQLQPHCRLVCGSQDCFSSSASNCLLAQKSCLLCVHI